MKPAPTIAAATLLRELLTDRDPRAVGVAARALEAIPIDHPMRRRVDAVLVAANNLRKGLLTPEDIRALADRLETP